MGYIYSINNLVNNKSYIGKCEDIDKRFHEHIRKLKNNNHQNNHLQYAWNKYGEDNFDFITILSDIDVNNLNYYEKLFIKFFMTNNSDYGYNLTAGGEGVNGYKHTEETISHLKQVRSEKFKNEKGYFYGRHHTEESKESISENMKGKNNPMYGKHHTEESKRKIRDKMIGINKGKSNANKKVTNDQIILIKNMLDDGMTQINISKILNIPQPKISLIKNNKY